MCSNAAGEFLAAIVLEHRDKVLESKTALARANLRTLSKFIAEHDGVLSWVPPAAGFTAFPRLYLNVDVESFSAGLAREESVLILPGTVFGVPDRFRLGFGMAERRFSDGLDALRRHLARVSP